MAGNYNVRLCISNFLAADTYADCIAGSKSGTSSDVTTTGAYFQVFDFPNEYDSGNQPGYCLYDNTKGATYVPPAYQPGQTYAGSSYTKLCLPEYCIPISGQETYVYFPSLYLTVVPLVQFAHARVQTETLPSISAANILSYLNNPYMCMGVQVTYLFWISPNSGMLWKFAQDADLNAPISAGFASGFTLP